MGSLHPDPPISGLASLELSSSPDHRRDPGQPDGDASAIDHRAYEARADPQARGTGARALDGELDASRLGRGHAETGRALRGRKADQFDHPGTTRGYEVDRDLDLAQRDIEWIGGWGAA